MDLNHLCSRMTVSADQQLLAFPNVLSRDDVMLSSFIHPKSQLQPPQLHLCLQLLTPPPFSPLLCPTFPHSVNSGKKQHMLMLMPQTHVNQCTCADLRCSGPATTEIWGGCCRLFLQQRYHIHLSHFNQPLIHT